MSYEVYKIIHLVGIVLLFSGLTGLLAIQMSTGKLEGKAKSLVFMSHGIGLLLILVAGFGMMARKGLISSIPGWIYAKLFIWLILGGILALVKRKGQLLGGKLFAVMLILFIAAAYLAIYQPF